MLIDVWLKDSATRLRDAGVGTARLDALVLLEDCLGTDRALLLAHPEAGLTPEQLAVLGSQIGRRAQHEPLAYIRGRTEFYGRVFSINNNVLEPRPESETMIDLLKKLVVGDAPSPVELAVATPAAALVTALGATPDPSPTQLTIVDVGTGSGALAVTAKCELPNLSVMAIDIDPACLVVAGKNARRHQAKIDFRAGDLLSPLFDTPSLDSALFALLCNLPYVPDNFHINQAATAEPRLAIFGGLDGLDLYRRLFVQIQKLPSRPQYVLTESMPPQHAELAVIAKKSGYSCHREDDFIQVFKLRPK